MILCIRLLNFGWGSFIDESPRSSMNLLLGLFGPIFQRFNGFICHQPHTMHNVSTKTTCNMHVHFDDFSVPTKGRYFEDRTLREKPKQMYIYTLGWTNVNMENPNLFCYHCYVSWHRSVGVRHSPPGWLLIIFHQPDISRYPTWLSYQTKKLSGFYQKVGGLFRMMKFLCNMTNGIPQYSIPSHQKTTALILCCARDIQVNPKYWSIAHKTLNIRYLKEWCFWKRKRGYVFCIHVKFLVWPCLTII